MLRSRLRRGELAGGVQQLVMTRRRRIVASVVVGTSMACVCVMTLLCLVLYASLERSPLSTIDEYSVLDSGGRMVTEINDETVAQVDAEWLPVLRNASIVRVERFENGLAPKYVAQLSTKHIVMIKFLANPALLHWFRSPQDWHEGERDTGVRLTARADRLYQGWPELVAFHLDRVLGFNRKPPVVGRVITNKELFVFDNDAKTTLHRTLPSYEIYASFHAWVHNLQMGIPTVEHMMYLSMIITEAADLSEQERQMALDISDTLVFDLLLDDHDRKWDFNWRTTAGGRLLTWDSGLAFRHGPIGSRSCLDILCGTTEWRELNNNRLRSNVCQRIVRFRRSTIAKLRAMSWLAPPSEQLVYRWRKAIESDPLAPVFNFGEFSDVTHRSWWQSKAAFTSDNFMSGLEYRMALLFEWVEQSIARYGEEAVLL